MTVIDVKGPVVDNETAMMYDFFGMNSVSPSTVSAAIDEANDNDDVTVNIASNGGDVFAASEIYTMLRSAPNNVVVNIQGLAASAASVIAMAGDTVNISPTAQIMIHQASTIAQGNKDDLGKQINALSGIDQSIASAYEEKTGIDQGQLLNMMSNETWIGAKDAVDQGFADNIMFAEEPTLQAVNAVSDIIPKSAVAKFLNLKAKADLEDQHEQVDEPVVEPDPSEKTEKSTIEEEHNDSRLSDLRNQKAAILLGKI
ncbi:hypothetical protein R55214_HHFBAMCI_01345 [Fructobacillus evanidus]|uniref:ATP-dependent Clp protease proteolytic subunit n=1 Tax=Fructobacillus evanidus TaxID=3064281 RepID=A0ABN9YX75_9LACO|nr:hypothetical protein R55214_HHFBAMCI_01345 [Fructobacillus sp. LMG 32999]